MTPHRHDPPCTPCASVCLALLATLALALPGCTSMFNHEVRLVPRGVRSVALARSSGKRVAVVMLEHAVKPYYTAQMGRHTLNFMNVRTALEDALRGTLQGKVREVVFFNGQAGGGFDGYIYPKLQVEMLKGWYGWEGLKCQMKLTLAVQNARGVVLKKQEHVGAKTFVSIRDVEPNCSDALFEAMKVVAPAVLSQIDAL